MPTLIRLDAGAFVDAEDTWVTLEDACPVPPGAVIVSSERLGREADALLEGGRAVGVRLRAEQGVEPLAYDLPRLALVALEFPKFRDGRAFTSAALLRQRYAFTGEIRAVGDVLRDQAFHGARCGFDAWAPSDGSTAEQWAAAARVHRHVYQRAQDGRAPAFSERIA